MTSPSHHQFQKFAHPVSLPGRCAIGRPASSSRRGRAAAIIHDQHQRLTRTERGKLVGMCASTLGVAKTGGRCARLGCSRRRFRPSLRLYDLLPNLARTFNGSGSFGQFDGIEAGTSHLVANLIQNGRQGTFQRLAKGGV